jgi:hypothetical protein
VGGRIFVQQEEASRAERSWTNPLNVLQEAKDYSFLCDYTLRVEKNYQHGLDA